MENKIVVGLVAGETSGDILGAGLIRSLKKMHPNIHFVGIAGPLMKKEGCDAWFEMEELSVMGIIEVLGRLFRILYIRREITKKFKALKPDIFIGIDAPDFNLTLEGSLKKSGIKTIHYVSPSVWAWKQRRVFKIKKNTDLVLAFLPFEKAFYDKFNVPCQFIGHKMADDIPLEIDPIPIWKLLQISENQRCFSILLGSRKSEIELLSKDFLETAQKLKERFPDLLILVPLANQKRREEFEKIKAEFAPNLELKLLDGFAREAMAISHAVLLASGTVALECMLVKTPMIVAYKLKKFTYFIVKRMIKIDSVSLPNILAGKKIVPEFLQNDCNSTNLFNALLPLFENENKEIKQIFLELHKQIRQNADEKAAKAVLSLID